MVVIRLFCAAGLSTSLLVNKMKEAAKSRGIEASIEAFPEGEIAKHLDNVDVALLGPQVRFRFEKAKEVCDARGVPIEVIPMVDYGMVNGAKVLDFALTLAK